MAIQSLHKIIQLENELYQKEQLEQQKLSAWIEKEQVEMDQYFASQRAELDLQNKQFHEKIEVDSKVKANTILITAKEKAESLNRIDDAFLKHSLTKIFAHISGKRS